MINWLSVFEGLRFGQVSGLGVDSQGLVYVFHRAETVMQVRTKKVPHVIHSNTIFVLDSETGEIKTQWGSDLFLMPHGLTVDQDNNLWVTDIGLHQVFKFDRFGKILMAIGEKGVPGSDKCHFNQPTDVAVAEDSSFYVSDGYKNSRVVRFSPEGEYLYEWGTKGNKYGQFIIPHSLALNSCGRVYVVDRGNKRVQVFEDDGNFVGEWKGDEIGCPWTIRFDSLGMAYVIDAGKSSLFSVRSPRIIKVGIDGKVLSSLLVSDGKQSQFTMPHAIGIGIDGVLYVGEAVAGRPIQAIRGFI